MFCTNCGAQMPDTAKFCNHCGTPAFSVQQPAAVPVRPAETPPVTEQPVIEQPVYAQPVTEQPVYAQPVYPQQGYDQPHYAPPAQPDPQPPKKKKGKGAVIAIVVILAVALLAVGGFFGLRYAMDLKTYDNAMSLYEDGEYAKALELFESIDIKDSARMATELRELLEEANIPTSEPEPSTDPSAEPTQPTAELEIAVTEAQLVYEMTDADVEVFYELLEKGEAAAMSDIDSDEVEAIIDELDAQLDYLETQYGIAMVLYYCDLNDEAASQLYLDATDTFTQANNDYLQMARRVYLSDSPHNDVLFEDWTEDELEMLVRYTEEVMELEQRNSEIEVAYQDMQDSSTMYDDMVPLYVEMVANNNRIAQIYGYDNYYEYAYDQVYARDYDGSQIELMRTYVSQYLPDAIQGSMDQCISSIQGLSFLDQMAFSSLQTDHFTRNESYITEYLQTLPSEARSTMLAMFDGDILLMQDVPGAMEGAFTTNLSKDRSVCFFGPGYSNVLTIIHEVGHYYGSMFTDLDEMPLDLAETQSQGNEWLFIGHLLTEDNSALTQAIRDYKMYSDLVTIAICVIVDDFEQQVYTHPNAANLTGDELDAIMEEVCARYGGIDFLAEVATDVQTYWRMVVVEQPVYYISYGVSAIAAMNIYTIAESDYEQAVQAYCQIIESVDLDKGFLGNITDAGLSGPFDEDVYIAISEMYS